MSRQLRDRMQAGVTSAIKARDAACVSVLRTTLAALANAEAVDATHAAPAVGLYAGEVSRRALTDDETREIVVHHRDDLRGTAGQLREHGRPREAAALDAKADVLDAYLQG